MAAPPVCQSCAMPLDHPEDYGTNADGSPSGEFCVHCYRDGGYTAPDMTFERMSDFLRDFMIREHEMDRGLADSAARMSVTGLKRWTER